MDNRTAHSDYTPQPLLAEDPNGDAIFTIFNQIAQKIIEQQESIIGPVAVERAKLVAELDIDWARHTVGVGGNPQDTINKLVEQYKELFGQIAVESCKQAVGQYMSQLSFEQQPNSLK